MESSKERLMRKLSQTDPDRPGQPIIFQTPDHEFARKRVWARLSDQIRNTRPVFSFGHFLTAKSLSLASLAIVAIVATGLLVLPGNNHETAQGMLFSHNHHTPDSIDLSKSPFTSDKTFALEHEKNIKLMGKAVNKLVARKSLGQIALEFESGEVTVDYTRKIESEKLTVKAGHHTVTVIGTVFTTELKNGKFTLTVQEGKVGVHNGTQQILVKAGQRYNSTDLPNSVGTLATMHSEIKKTRPKAPRIPVREINEKDLEKLLGNQQ